MKNKNQSLNTDAKSKMLFSSDGFEFFIKFLTVIFTVIRTLLLIGIKIIGLFLETSSRKKVDDHIDNYVSLDPLKTEGENKLNGTGYYK